MLYKSKAEAHKAYRSSPRAFFEKYHDLHFNERELISADWEWYETKYHYNLVENGIIDTLRENKHKLTGNTVLDVGAGTGHWIDFYYYYLKSKEIVGIDFSKVSVKRLKNTYKKLPGVRIVNLDITSFAEEFNKRFDVINAIGIMFHIVDDKKWQSALNNICSYLKKDGIAIIGGDFGRKTEELGVMRRVRSLTRWKSAVQKASGEITGLKRFNWFKGGTQEGLKNNLLAFRRM